MQIAKDAENDSKVTYNRAKRTILISIIIGLFLSITIGIFIVRIISKPIIETTLLLKDISEGNGDLTKRLKVQSKDEIGQLSEYFNLFVDKIQHLVSQVKDNANLLVQSTGEIDLIMEQSNKCMEEIGQGISNVADSSQNNASVVEETTSSIEEVANSTEVISQETENIFKGNKQILDFTNLGAKNILEVVQANDSVKKATKEVYNSIGELKKSSDRVGEIVTIITNISEQTNLLALNAAIEAARAGEQGKGFAVVAEEVRKLAEESKESAEEISSVMYEIQSKADNANLAITEGQQLVEVSVEKVNDTNEQFKEIMQAIERITEKIEMVAASSKHQMEITEEMTKAMDSISTTTQDNASSVQQINEIIEEQVSSIEEVGASIEELKNVAFDLKDKTDIFKV